MASRKPGSSLLRMDGGGDYYRSPRNQSKMTIRPRKAREMSKHMEDRFLGLLKKFSQGLGVDELNREYKKAYGELIMPFDFGCSSILELVLKYPKIFRFNPESRQLFSAHLKDPILLELAETNFRRCRNSDDQDSSTVDGMSDNEELDEVEREEYRRKYWEYRSKLTRLSGDGDNVPEAPVPVIEEASSNHLGKEEKDMFLRKKTEENIRSVVDKYIFDGGILVDNFLKVYEDELGTRLDLSALGFVSFSHYLDYLQKQCIVAIQHNGKADIVTWFPGKDNQPVREPLRAVLEVGEMPPRQAIPRNMENGSSLPIIVFELTHPQEFYFILHQNHQQLDSLVQRMAHFYENTTGYQMLYDDVFPGLPCAVLHDCGFWYRAQVVRLLGNAVIRLFLVDDGSFLNVRKESLRYLLKEFGSMPAQAIQGSLHKISPPVGSREWHWKSAKRFLTLVTEYGESGRLLGCVASPEIVGQPTQLILKYSETGNIGDQLISEGLASKALVYGANSKDGTLQKRLEELKLTDETEK